MRNDWNTTRGHLRRLSAVLLLGLLLSVGPPALADDRGDSAPRSLEEAVAQIERAHSGRILSARGEQQGQGVVYRIRLLTADQQVRNFELAGAEGARP